MKVSMFLSILLTVPYTLARPDVSHLKQQGYQYQVPATSYGVPIGSVGQLDNTRQYYQSQGGQVSPTAPSTVIQTPIREYSQFRGDTSGTFNRIQGPESGISGGASFQQGPESGISGGASFQQGPVEVQKHVYFYAAPEEPEEVRSRVQIPVAPAKKNIKIIFIKAPSYAAAAPINIPLQPQNEEKTLVYVLVKKPEEQAEINIPTAAPTKPSKPEVYFINYKTQQEAQNAISNLQTGVTDSRVSVSANSIEGDQEFVSVIGQDRVKTGFGDQRLADGSASTPSTVSATLTPQVTSGGSFEIDRRVSGATGTPHQLYGPPQTSN